VLNIDFGKLPTSLWCAPLDASGLLMSAPAASRRGIAVSGAAFGTGSCAAMPAAPRHRGPAGAMGLAGVPALAQGAKRYGQPTNNQTHIEKQYATSGSALGVGASGPPRKREPA